MCCEQAGSIFLDITHYGGLMELGVILSCAVVSYIDPQLKKLITARFHPSQQQNTHILSTLTYVRIYVPYRTDLKK